MADADVTITAGTGTKIDTRTVGAGVDEHRQVVVIGDPSTAANVAGVDAAFGLDVDVTRLPALVAGDALIGRTKISDGTTVAAVATTGELNTMARRDLQRVAVGITGVTTATTAYTAGDQVGVVFTIANAARVSGGGGVITGVTLIDQSDIIGAYDLVLFDSSVTLAADNAAFAISDADALKIVAIVQLAGAFDITNNRIAQAYNLAVPYLCSGGTSLFGALITRGGHTFFTAGALPQVNVYVERY
jgi:hypothetical protein